MTRGNCVFPSHRYILYFDVYYYSMQLQPTVLNSARNMEQNDEPSHLVQRLMSCDEVYLYKIPPMKDSGGHRYVLRVVNEETTS